MKKIIYLFVFTLISFSSMGGVVDFSGTWNLNKEKSTLNDQFSMAPSKLILVQAPNNLEVKRHASYQGEDFIINDQFTLDGKECINKGWQDSEKKSTIAWSEDTKLMTITSKIPMQDGEMTILEVFQMENDHLKVVTSVSSSYGDITETHIFDKQ